MPNVIITPNMLLPNPVPGVDPGPDYANNNSSAFNIVDGHNHSPGKGAPIGTDGLSIGNDLPLNGNSLTSVKSIDFSQQISNATLNSLFVGTDGNLYFNDGASDPSIQITAGGIVNVVGSGISSPPATASFVSSVLVVNAESNTPANIQGASLLLGNNVAASKFLTLSPPSAMVADFSLVLPSLPGATSFLSLDSSGNIAPAVATSHGITGSNIQTNVNLPGSSVQENGLNVAVSNTNAANSLAIVRGSVDSTGAIDTGEGFTVVKNGTGAYTVTYSTAFGDPPAVVIGSVAINTIASMGVSSSNAFCTVNVVQPGGTPANAGFSIISIGQRA